jgi:hypothetical protein
VIFGEKKMSSPMAESKMDDDADPTGGAPSRQGSIKIKPGSQGTEAQNSFSADSPYFSSYVDSELRSMSVMHDTLRDLAGRTKTFGKCGALMSESTRRLAMSCRLRRPYMAEDEKEMEIQEQQMERDVTERRHALGEDMAGLLSVMAEVSDCGLLLT